MALRAVIQGRPRIALKEDSTSTTWNSIGIDSGPISMVRVMAPRLGRLMLSKADMKIVLCDRSASLISQRQRVLIGATQTEALVSTKMLSIETPQISRVTQIGRFWIFFNASSYSWKDIVEVGDIDMSIELICSTGRFSRTITFWRNWERTSWWDLDFLINFSIDIHADVWSMCCRMSYKEDWSGLLNNRFGSGGNTIGQIGRIGGSGSWLKVLPLHRIMF